MKGGAFKEDDKMGPWMPEWAVDDEEIRVRLVGKWTVENERKRERVFFL